MDTAYGDPEAIPPVSDLERYILWAARMRREMHRPASQADD
jgi:hypothetical protein